jgi:hypothetical protein
MVVAGVSEALRQVLFEDLHSDPDTRQLFHNVEDIVFKNPTETAQDTANRLSLWLYQITENEFVKNQSPMRANGSNTLQHAPLALDFSFLITPFANIGGSNGSSRDENHMVLGKVMQIFHDNSIILLRDSTNDIAEELRIIFKRLTLEELTRIWEALRESYRLSICYRVQVSRIDSSRVSGRARVVERLTGNSTDVAGAVG